MQGCGGFAMRVGMIGLMAAMLSSPAAAVVVANTLPTGSSTAWTEVVFSGTSMISSGGVTTMTTANNRGVFFGRGSGSGITDPLPSWSLASNALGNYLSVTAKLSSGADDWLAYIQDGARGAFMAFNPTTPCDPTLSNCYLQAGVVGVELRFATGSQFVAIDTTQYFTYEILLQGSQVVYRVNGQRYAGEAIVSTSNFLLVGDNTGSSRSGTGSFSLTAVTVDAAPAFTDLPGAAVPEPASWALLVTGFGLAGAMQRRRRPAQISA